VTVHLALTELKLLLRKRVTAFSVLAVPVMLCVMAWTSKPSGNWAPLLGTLFTVLLMLSVFMVSTTVFTARRQSFVLQRLRTSELSDSGIYLGIGGPIVVVGLAQVLVFFGFCVAIGAPLPDNPVLVLLGVVLGLVVALLAGIATAAFSRSVEVTQITAIPVLLAAMTGLILLGSARFATVGAFLPMIGPSDLVIKGWSGGGSQLYGLGTTIPWLLVFGTVALRMFRWEPRQ
jgi:ABC-2 type transport system permease protein